jgi:hypothetical protein
VPCGGSDMRDEQAGVAAAGCQHGELEVECGAPEAGSLQRGVADAGGAVYLGPSQEGAPGERLAGKEWVPAAGVADQLEAGDGAVDVPRHGRACAAPDRCYWLALRATETPVARPPWRAGRRPRSPRTR